MPATKPAAQQSGRTLWGRLLRAPAATPAKPVKPVASVPTARRSLTAKDALWTVDTQGRRVYVPLAVEGVPGRWAGREWQHCGSTDRVMLVAWAERDNAMADQHGCALADGAVRIIEGGQAG